MYRHIDEFTDVERIGFGMAATVYAATDSRDGHSYALKMYQDISDFNELFNGELSIELTVAAYCQSQHLVPCLDLVFRDEDLETQSAGSANSTEPSTKPVSDIANVAGYGLIMPLAEIDLRTALRKYGQLPDPRQAAISVLKAIIDLNRTGIIHGDIKADNCLLFADGSVKLADTGLAKLRQLVNGSDEDHVAYSLAYKPPEVLFDLDYTVKADVWAFGCLLYELYTGDILFYVTKFEDYWYKVLKFLGPLDEKTEMWLRLCQAEVDVDDITVPLTLKPVPEDIMSVVRACLTVRPELRPSAEAVLGMLGGTHPNSADLPYVPYCRRGPYSVPTVAVCELLTSLNRWLLDYQSVHWAWYLLSWLDPDEDNYGALMHAAIYIAIRSGNVEVSRGSYQRAFKVELDVNSIATVCSRVGGRMMPTTAYNIIYYHIADNEDVVERTAECSTHLLILYLLGFDRELRPDILASMVLNRRLPQPFGDRIKSGLGECSGQVLELLNIDFETVLEYWRISGTSVEARSSGSVTAQPSVEAET